MDKKTLRFFRYSIAAVILVCAVVFLSLTTFMTRQTKRTVTEISNTYMAEVNQQIQQKFRSVISLRLEQLEGIIKRTPPEGTVYGQELLEELQLSAEIRNFIYLSFLAEDGTTEVIYGSDIKVSDIDEALDSLKQELFNLRFKHATGQLENANQLNFIKKDIARVKTVLRQRELNISVEPKSKSAKKAK